MKKVKISHLFHWLYAILMLLPVFAIGVTCAYAIFNKNAYQSYDKQNVLKEVEVQNDSMLLNNYNYIINIRTFIDNTDSASSGTSPNLYPKTPIDWTKYQNIQSDVLSNVVQFQISRANASYLNIYLKDNTDTQIVSISKHINTWKSYNDTDLIIPFTLINSRSFTNAKYGTYLQQITYIQENIDNVFYYSIDKVQQSPLFSWSYDSFLAGPFEYITDVFSIPHGNIIVFFASYWLAVSIIWLCFDLVMYVPNLVHKWLDKGSIS